MFRVVPAYMTRNSNVGYVTNQNTAITNLSHTSVSATLQHLNLSGCLVMQNIVEGKEDRRFTSNRSVK